MPQDKNSNGNGRRFNIVAIEAVFWAAVLSVSFFMNISPHVLKTTNPAFLIIFLVAMLAILSANLLPSILGRVKKIIFSVLIYAIVFFALFLFFKGANFALSYYYLPAAIAMAMAFLLIVKPKSSVAILVAVCVFLLGEAFWNMHVDSGNKIVLPAAFLRIYSLSMVVMFSYYLYAREAQLRYKLKALNQRLESLDNMKSNFMANVSHELRTPLTSIKNACALLKKKEEAGHNIDISTKELLSIVDASVDRQSRLVDNLLDLAKIESGKVFTRRLLMDVGPIAKEVAASLRMQANAKDIDLRVDISPDLPKVYASSEQIAVVFTNLLDNAIKYTNPKGKVCLEIVKCGHGVKSIITDTGIGIKKDDVGKLFERFQRLVELSQNKPKGTGLGLVITKEIIQLHGGEIWIESEYGAGSKFIFTIPAGLRGGDKAQWIKR